MLLSWKKNAIANLGSGGSTRGGGRRSRSSPRGYPSRVGAWERYEANGSAFRRMQMRPVSAWAFPPTRSFLVSDLFASSCCVSGRVFAGLRFNCRARYNNSKRRNCISNQSCPTGAIWVAFQSMDSSAPWMIIKTRYRRRPFSVTLNDLTKWNGSFDSKKNKKKKKKAEDFCDDSNHHKDVPTKHNVLCHERSVWDVIQQHAVDFAPVQDDSVDVDDVESSTDHPDDVATPFSPPQFHYIAPTAARYVLLLDRSQMMAKSVIISKYSIRISIQFTWNQIHLKTISNASNRC